MQRFTLYYAATIAFFFNRIESYSLPLLPNDHQATTDTRKWFKSHVHRTTALSDRRQRWDDEIEENSVRRAQQNLSRGGSIGETAVGAVLGGLLGGPFGALFGASIGSNFGAQNALTKARKEELQRLGISQDMLDMANDVGLSLEQSYEGLKASRESLITQQRLAKLLEQDAVVLYQKAKTAMTENNDSKARSLLLKRTEIQDKLKDVLKRCADERKRIEQMEENISLLERKAMEIDSLMRRSVSAKSLQESTGLGLSLQSEDPLLKRFKDLGID